MMQQNNEPEPSTRDIIAIVMAHAMLSHGAVPFDSVPYQAKALANKMIEELKKP